MKEKIMFFIFVSTMVIGCAGKFNYIPPTPPTNSQNIIIVDMSKDAVWEKIIPALASSFFVINNLDKNSGLINISYSGDPEKYINCGEIHSYVQNLRGERHYVFPASIGYKEYETMKNGQLRLYKRKMNLDGRINIVVQEVAPKQTQLTVTTRYVLIKEIWASNSQGQSEHMNESISFITNGSSSYAQGGTTCCANGEFEKEIFKIMGF